jgi:hypothetical protein
MNRWQISKLVKDIGALFIPFSINAGGIGTAFTSNLFNAGFNNYSTNSQIIQLVSKYRLAEINWFRGFVDGEASFTVGVTNTGVNSIFKIELHRDEKATLIWINSHFFNNQGSLRVSNTSVKLRVRSIKVLSNTIVPLFTAFPLKRTK